MLCSIVVATFGERHWQRLARQRAVPSAVGQGAAEIVPVHLDHGTLAEARNLGAEKATGDWLCFLDADDELAPGYLQAMSVIATAGYTAEMLGGLISPTLLIPAVQFIPDDNRRGSGILGGGHPLHHLNRAVIGTLIPRPLFLDLGGFNELPVYEDWDLWLRAERAGVVLVEVPDAVYCVHVREGSRNVPTAAAKRLYWELRREHEQWMAR